MVVERILRILGKYKCGFVSLWRWIEEWKSEKWEVRGQLVQHPRGGNTWTAFGQLYKRIHFLSGNHKGAGEFQSLNREKRLIT